MSVKGFRLQAINRLRVIGNYLESLGEEYSESDKQLDDFLRIWGRLPQRPPGRNPYEGLFPTPTPTPTLTAVTPPTISATPPRTSILTVPYFSQRDNRRESWRTCFSSSCAMLLKFLRPNSINGDDEYIDVVFRFGDTTESHAQIRALKHFGLNAQFTTNLSYSNLTASLERRIPIPTGFLHQGPPLAPTGGGHWWIVIGETTEELIVHDPWGDINTNYTNHNGRAVRYRKSSFERRWMVEGRGSGWGIIIP